MKFFIAIWKKAFFVFESMLTGVLYFDPFSFKGRLHGFDVILGPTRIRIFLYCRYLRQK